MGRRAVRRARGECREPCRTGAWSHNVGVACQAGDAESLPELESAIQADSDSKIFTAAVPPPRPPPCQGEGEIGLANLMPNPLVVTENLTKRYGAFTALRHCTLTVQAGEVFGLLGPNGSGKTTLLRTLMGFLRPSAGRATIAGWDCYRESRKTHGATTYLPGDARLFRGMNGFEVLQFFQKVRPDGNLPRALELAQRLDLDLSRPVTRCSTGMRQKLGVVSILAVRAPLVILDEPTSNLDPTTRSQVLGLVQEAKAEGRTVMFSSHVLSEVEAVCDRVVVLRRGELVHSQAMAELKRQHRIEAQLLGGMPDLPPDLHSLEVERHGQGWISLRTAGELLPVLHWLSEQQVSDIRVRPLGLQTVYERFHPHHDANEVRLPA